MVGSGLPLNSAGVTRLYIFPAKQQRQSTMKLKPATPAVDNAADGVNIHTFLQRAIDHYPQQVAFSFKLLLPYSDTLADNSPDVRRERVVPAEPWGSQYHRSTVLFGEHEQGGLTAGPTGRNKECGWYQLKVHRRLSHIVMRCR